jgi:hypothetical protein
MVIGNENMAQLAYDHDTTVDKDPVEQQRTGSQGSLDRVINCGISLTNCPKEDRDEKRQQWHCPKSEKIEKGALLAKAKHALAGETMSHRASRSMKRTLAFS